MGLRTGESVSFIFAAAQVCGSKWVMRELVEQHLREYTHTSCIHANTKLKKENYKTKYKNSAKKERASAIFMANTWIKVFINTFKKVCMFHRNWTHKLGVAAPSSSSWATVTLFVYAAINFFFMPEYLRSWYMVCAFGTVLFVFVTFGIKPLENGSLAPKRSWGLLAISSDRF